MLRGRDGLLHMSEISHNVSGPEATAMLVIDEIENTDLGRIRNFAGYFMGICNKFLRGGPPGAPQNGLAKGVSRGREGLIRSHRMRC